MVNILKCFYCIVPNYEKTAKTERELKLNPEKMSEICYYFVKFNVKNILYSDTDSIIFNFNDNNWKHLIFFL